MSGIIIGRDVEIAHLTDLAESGQAELLAVYGRRRIGKTYLIRNFFKDTGLFLEITGQQGASLPLQLNNFMRALKHTFSGIKGYLKPVNWNEALQILIDELEKHPKGKQKILFFDELPWLAGRKSGIMSALDYFWNTWASKRPDVIVIVCGSSASWMIKHVIHQKGGLHNRITSRMRLLPFTLSETEKFIQSRNINYSRKQIIEIYMAMGGVPHYLQQLKRGLSPAQNLDLVCFNKDGILSDELKLMFSSLFENADKYVEVVRLLAKKRKGLSRDEIIKGIKVTTGGGLSSILTALEESGFISKSATYKRKTRDLLYRLVDEYTLFYFHWIESAPRNIFSSQENKYWQKCAQSRRWTSWAGFSFESVCLKHSYKIKQALGISGISTVDTAWRFNNPDTGGTQIDLLIDRSDQCINVCEIKFSDRPFKLTKVYADKLMKSIEQFRCETGTRKSCFLTMITTFGVVDNQYVEQCVDNQLTMDALF